MKSCNYNIKSSTSILVTPIIKTKLTISMVLEDLFYSLFLYTSTTCPVMSTCPVVYVYLSTVGFPHQYDRWMGLYKSLHKAVNDLEAEPPNDLGLKQSERKRVTQDVG